MFDTRLTRGKENGISNILADKNCQGFKIKLIERKKMKKLKKSISIAVISLSFMVAFVACATQTEKEEVSEKNEKPSVAQLHAYKAMHHAI
ncbi:MAG: hypothetical protein ABUJ92_14195, partial [Desulfobacterales bacterium]